MKGNVRKILLVTLSILIAGIWGCKPSEPVEPNTPQDYLDAASTAEDLARVSDIEDENWKYIEGPYIDNDYIEKTTGCPIVSWSPQKDSLTLTFGANGQPCVGSKRRSYQGTLTATHSGTPKQVGFTINVAVNLTIDGNQYNGTHVYRLDSIYVTNTGDSVWVIGIERSSNVAFGDGSEVSISGTFSLSKIKTANGSIRYELTGQGSGVNRKGQNFTYSIPTTIEYSTTCDWIYKGIFKLVTDKGVVIEFDYGYPNNGQCDNKAQVSVDGGKFTREVILK